MTKIKNILSLIITVTTLVCSCSAFLLADNCPAPSPCTCSGSSSSYSYVHCESKGLKDIPYIKRSNNHVATIHAYFYSNSLTIINNNAFKNFSSINATNIDLRLYNNKIHTIGNNAFSGIENATQRLELYNNNLTTIPSAIGKLVNLKYLYIQSNPLHSVDYSVMSNIGRSLTSLNLDMGSLTEWPQGLHYLRVLQRLVAGYIPFSHLDINAFHGFESTLTYLQLDYAKLEKVPYAICHLNHLTSLYFRYDKNLKENRSTIFEPCSGKLPTVTSLYLENDNLHTFPDIFTLFPSLTTLSLSGNRLVYIESTKIPPGSKLTTITLNSNLFERIPYALNKLKFLITINIIGNKIKIIETTDLTGLDLLQQLRIYNNPIVYIAPNAFKHNFNLNHLDLDNTQLDHVPTAVIHLPKLRTFYLSGRPIDCTCDMSYLKHWNATAVTPFTTKCASSTETIKTFVMNSLQSCP